MVFYRRRRSLMSRRAFFAARKHREICKRWLFVIPAFSLAIGRRQPLIEPTASNPPEEGRIGWAKISPNVAGNWGDGG